MLHRLAVASVMFAVLLGGLSAISHYSSSRIPVLDGNAFGALVIAFSLVWVGLILGAVSSREMWASLRDRGQDSSRRRASIKR